MAAMIQFRVSAVRKAWGSSMRPRPVEDGLFNNPLPVKIEKKRMPTARSLMPMGSEKT